MDYNGQNMTGVRMPMHEGVDSFATLTLFSTTTGDGESTTFRVNAFTDLGGEDFELEIADLGSGYRARYTLTLREVEGEH